MDAIQYGKLLPLVNGYTMAVLMSKFFYHQEREKAAAGGGGGLVLNFRLFFVSVDHMFSLLYKFFIQVLPFW